MRISFTNFIPMLSLELICFGFSLTAVPPLLKAIIAFPALFIIPGAMLLTILIKRIYTNALQLVVEGFFISTIIMVMLTSVMLALGLSLTSFNYSIIALSFVSILAIIGFTKKIEIKPSKHDILLLALVFTVYVVLMFFLSTFPRLITPDETTYIFSARMGILNGKILPMGVAPNQSSVIVSLFQGREFWIYLLDSFLGSTGMPAYQAGLIGVGFLIMTALASSLLVKGKGKWLSAVVFGAVAFNPLLFSFSSLALNDLAISFYAVFAVLFFVKAFTKKGKDISLNLAPLSFSLISIIVLTLIKPNLLVFLVIWIILVSIMFMYKVYKQNKKYKLLSITIFLPVVGYELFIDLPYVISVWIFRNGIVGGFFKSFLLISPIELFTSWFVAPWWNPSASTVFTHSFSTCIAYFYGFLMPESSSLLVSAIILALPILIISRDMRKELDKTILTLIVLLSLCLFYFTALSSFNLSDVARYSLWMIPLWIPLALMTLQDIYDSSSFKKFFPVLVTAVVLLWINIWLSETNGGVYIGYSLPSLVTTDALLAQFMGMIVLISLLFFREDLSKFGSAIGKKLSALKIVNLKKTVFCFLIILILSNSFYFASQFMEKSSLYENHGLTTISNALGNVADNGSLVFANNYIYMRPYMTDQMFEEGLLLPPPDTETEFLSLLQVAPNNTVVLINNDQAISWYEYANNYITSYADADIITADKPDMTSLAEYNLSGDVLQMSFDSANSTFVPDLSASKNNGLNVGAQVVKGYIDNALQFNGTGYVAIPNSDTLNIQNTITISFLASIEKAEPNQGYIMLSKGYAEINGSYDIFIWDSKIYFELGGVGYLSFPVSEYLGEWHDFIFTYDGKTMTAFVDGVPVATQSASGVLRSSKYDVEIGRDNERKSLYFFGEIDQLQISDKPLNTTLFAETTLKNYAIETQELYGINGNSTYFKIIHRNSPNTEANVLVSGAKIAINNNLTITLNLSVTSNTAVNSTILVSTDRFTEVYSVNLTKGFNDVKFEYPYVSNLSQGGSYWLYLTQARVILIVGGTVIFNSPVSLLNPALMNIYLLLITGIILTAYLLITYISRNRFDLP